MRNFLYIVTVFFCFSACKPGIPKDIIQPKEMALVLHDIHIADGYIGMNMRPDSVKIKAAEYYKGIYKKYDIDSALYARSMNYYTREPKVFNDIYVEVTRMLTNEKDMIVKRDSILNAKEMMKQRMKVVRDSTRHADSTFWANFLLKPSARLKAEGIKDTLLVKDTALLKDTLKKSIDVMKLRMDYKGLKDLK